jgi:hypothetical protein
LGSVVGFSATDVKGLSLVVGQELPQDIALKIGVVQQEVTLAAAAPIVDTSSSEVGTGIVEREQSHSPGRLDCES